MVNQRVRELSNDLVVLSARLVREVRRNNSAIPAGGTRVLSLLDELGPSTVGGLAVADRCSQPTMTGLVNGLAGKGWVDRTAHPNDARSSLVSLSDEGRRTLADVRRRNAALVAERLDRAGHTSTELATAVAVLSDALSTAEPDPEGPA